MTHSMASFEEAFFHDNKTYVHPTALVGPNVVLEAGAKIAPYAIITGNVTIGSGTRIYPNVMIGFPGEITGMMAPQGRIEIGNNCEIREFVTIHASKYTDGCTRIGDNAYIMNYCHVSHDVTLEHNVVMINNVQLAGHTYVEHHAFLMANSATHQFVRIGQYTSMAPYSGLRQDAPPFCIFNGVPGAFQGLNSVALRRAGLSSENILALKRITTLFYQKKATLETIQEIIATDQLLTHDPYIQAFITFIQQSQRGVSRKSAIDSSSSFEARI